MAENLVFPIGFDLEAAVKKAGQEWDSTYADKMEKLLSKRAVKIKLGFDTRNLDNLDDVRQRLAQLKIEPMTPANKTAIQDLVRELKELAKAMEKVQKYSNIQTPELQQALANKANAEATHMAEKYRQANERVEIAKRRVTLAEQKYADTVFYSSKATREQTRAYQEQTTYLNRLLKRMATYWSVRQVQNFITSVREVTAQFELQKVSLGAIIQDQARANQLFSEIKAFALKSPASIMDLTKYTKQLAAYKIETDELFETTKKLTDISVGLSVSLDRVILAYGQVRARGALYSSEIRQFTEMGVPIVEELAAKLTKVNGQLVTSAQVLKMVEKGAISFELVKEVFDDMTSAGGAFYNMQERQGNTLFGMWQKLSDAASVMYDEIGNTDNINKGMKESIALMTDLMKNWRYFANALIMVVPTMLLVHNIEKSRAATSARQIAAMNTLTAATSKRMVAEKALNQAIASGLANTAAKARMNLILAQTEEKVAQKALTAGNNLGLLGKRFNLFGGALKSLSAFVATNFWTILLTGIALLTSALVSANEKANRLKNTLAEIGASGSLELSQSVQNFERLAKIAVESADGSKKQRDALDELHRTYKEMIPVQDMTIEKLRAMNGDYRKLTIAIEEYIRARLKQQQIDAVTSEIGADLAKYERKMTEDAQGFFYTYDKGATKLKLTYGQIQLLIKGIKEIAKTERNLPTRKVFAKALTDYVGLDAKNLEVGLDEWLNTFDDGLFGIVRSVRQFEGEIDRIKANETLDTTLGKYAESWKKVNERIENLTVKGAKVGTFAFDRATANASVKQYVGYLKEVLGNAWDESFASIEEHVGANGENMSAIYWEAVMKNWDTYTVAQQNAILKVQKAYDGLLPSDRTVVILREKLQQISGQFGVNMDITKQYLMNAGEDIETYAKRVKSSLEEAQNSLKKLRFNKSQIDAGVGTGVLKPVSDEEIEKADNLTKVLAALFELISAFAKGKSSGGGHKSDPRLQNLKEEISLVQKLYNEYKQLEKQEGATKAAADMRKMAGGTLDIFKEKYNIDLPTDAKDLTAALEILYAKMAQLPKKVFPALDKDLKELRWTIEKVNIDESQKNIEAELKRLADRISRTKTAREFYEKILNTTGDIELATNITVSVYGQNGQDLQDALLTQIKKAFETIPDKEAIDLSAAVDFTTGAIDYNKLAELEEKYQDVLISGRADLRKKLIEDGRKTSAQQAQQWLKDIEKAKDYSQKRIDLASYTANQIAAINARGDLSQGAKDTLIKGYQEREAKEMAKLQYEAFKDSAMYVHIFEDLDNASTTALKNMKDRLVALKGQWQHLDPTQVKELTARIREIDEQLAKKNPFKVLVDNFKALAKARPQAVIDADLIAATDLLAQKENELTAATNAYTAAQTAQLDAQAKVQQARQELAQTIEAYGEDSPEVEAARETLRLNIENYNTIKAASQSSIANAKKQLDKARDAYNTQKDVVDGLEEEANVRKKLIDLIYKANAAIDEYQSQINEALDGVRKMMVAFGAGDEDLQFFDDVMGAINEIVDAGQQAAMSVASFMSGNILGGITSGVSAIGGLISGFSNLFHAGKVKRANKEIKRQQELLEQLEYTYGRLQNAADKLFGVDYLQNYNQQLRVLEAERQAELKKAQAERSKGKKEDEKKTKEYLNNARDIADQIRELQEGLFAHFTGQSRQDIARQMANSWIDARASMSDTFAAIKGDYKDLIKNMLVETMAAKIIENAFSQVWDDVDKRLKANDVDGAVNAFINGMDTALANANDGMEVWWKAMEARGYNMKEMFSDMDKGYIGIAKDVAGATSEEINANTTALNTQNYYVSHIPIISENVAAIRAMMQGGTVSTPTTTTAVDTTALQTEAMNHYKAIENNTAATVAQLMIIVDKLNSALYTKGSKRGFNVWLNS